jgi:hypothetical protein
MPLSSSTNVPIERHVSHGSIWSVGGLAPSGTAVNNGRGHLVQARTNARMFRTNYSTAKLKVNEELKKHRDRLATALDFNQTRRTFDFHSNAKPLKTQQNMLKESDRSPRKTYWDGAEWKNNNPAPSKKPPPAHPYTLEHPYTSSTSISTVEHL